jgi:hypothetical protein
MLEAMVYDADGQCRTTFMDYLLPTAADVPAMTVDHIESPSIDTAGGFKGVGGVSGAPRRARPLRLVNSGQQAHPGARARRPARSLWPPRPPSR